MNPSGLQAAVVLPTLADLGCLPLPCASGAAEASDSIGGAEQKKNSNTYLSTESGEVQTGPTFSVYGEGPHHPASHNVTMLLRHHRYCAEADGAGLTVIPNLYWRTRADRRLWSAWLRAHESVGWIARDFSRTKQWSDFRPS